MEENLKRSSSGYQKRSSLLFNFLEGIKMVEKEKREESWEQLIKKLVEYEIECHKRQPQFFENPMAEIDYRACEECPLHRGGSFCRLGEVRMKLRDQINEVPLVFRPLVETERIEKET